MSTEPKLGIFNKARVSNIMAAVTISVSLYAFVTGVVTTPVEGSMMGMIAGFAAKHLWDSSQS